MPTEINSTKYTEVLNNMNTRRKNEILANTLEWFLENIKDDAVLYNTLHEVIGWQKSELHDFSIESLDEYFDEQEDETTDMITAEDLAEQLVYATFAQKNRTPMQKSEDMLSLLGANIIDDDIFYEESENIGFVTSIETIVKYGIDHQKDGQCLITHELCKELTNGFYTSPWDIDERLREHIGVADVEFDPDSSGLILNIARNYITQDDDEGFSQSM